MICGPTNSGPGKTVNKSAPCAYRVGYRLADIAAQLDTRNCAISRPIAWNIWISACPSLAR